MRWRSWARRSSCAAASGVPAPAFAHDAFGDLGPFYANLLHPLADPAQGLLLAAIAVLLAAQPAATVRPAYVALAVAGGAAVFVGAALALDPLGLRGTGLVVAAFGAAALAGVALPPALASLLAAAAAIAAGLTVEVSARAAGLSALGAALGIALASLLIWGLVDAAHRRFGLVAVKVAGAWLAAIGVMAAAVP